MTWAQRAVAGVDARHFQEEIDLPIVSRWVTSERLKTKGGTKAVARYLASVSPSSQGIGTPASLTRAARLSAVS